MAARELASGFLSGKHTESMEVGMEAKTEEIQKT
jgi:hypothetical protein